jgi:hypothetical protein
MTKSQQAVARAIIYPEPNKTGKAGPEPLKNLDGSERQMLSQARSIVRWSRELAQDVLAGRKAFDEALKQVNKELAESITAEARLAELRRCAPDLADLVDDERRDGAGYDLPGAGAWPREDRRRQEKRGNRVFSGTQGARDGPSGTARRVQAARRCR